MGRSLTSRFASSFLRRCLSACALIAMLTAAATAEEITWRYDYNSARREAMQKGRPLMIDFSTDQCFWCIKLDNITFHDPAVVASVNEHFVPLKINASRNPTLTEYLRIQAFPTVVLADPEGKILGTLEGFMEPTRFQEQLQRAMAAVSNPEWMTREYQAASKAIADSDYSRALAIIATILEDGKNRPVQVKAKQLKQEIDALAEQRLVQARKDMDQNRSSDAMEKLADLMKRFPGTHASDQATSLVKRITDTPDIKARQRSERARELLAQAREDFKLQHYLGALDRCDILVNSYFDTPEGTEALALANEIKSNPEWMRKACEMLGERLGVLYMSLAETWIKKGQPDQARMCLEHVIQTLPGTHQADMAQARLDQLQGHPTHQAIFKEKPKP
jgi:thioredoxin-related protein